MHTSLFLTADYANLTAEGKLNIMGIFSVIYARQFPARHPSMHLIVKLEADLGEDGQTRDLRILLLDPDGHRLLEVGSEMQVPHRTKGQKPEINAIIAIRDVVFPVPGPYSFVLIVDKDHKSSLSLLVETLDVSAPAQQ